MSEDLTALAGEMDGWLKTPVADTKKAISADLRQAIDLVDRARAALVAAQKENDWYRTVIAEECGYDGPVGDGCNPLRDILHAYHAACEMLAKTDGNAEAQAEIDRLTHQRDQLSKEEELLDAEVKRLHAENDLLRRALAQACRDDVIEIDEHGEVHPSPEPDAFEVIESHQPWKTPDLVVARDAGDARAEDDERFAREVAEEAVQRLADSDPTDLCIEAQDLIAGSAAEGLFCVDAKVLTGIIEATVSDWLAARKETQP